MYNSAEEEGPLQLENGVCRPLRVNQSTRKIGSDAAENAFFFHPFLLFKINENEKKV